MNGALLSNFEQLRSLLKGEAPAQFQFQVNAVE
jgi:hypothetical protein